MQNASYCPQCTAPPLQSAVPSLLPLIDAVIWQTALFDEPRPAPTLQSLLLEAILLAPIALYRPIMWLYCRASFGTRLVWTWFQYALQNGTDLGSNSPRKESLFEAIGKEKTNHAPKRERVETVCVVCIVCAFVILFTRFCFLDTS